MKKTIGALSAIALFAFAGSALAEEVSGKIQSLNEDARSITLDDGMTYQLGEGVSLQEFSEGQNVTLSLEEENGQKVAQDIEADASAGAAADADMAPPAAPEASPPAAPQEY
jgi:maltose-binding protein MalE